MIFSLTHHKQEVPHLNRWWDELHYNARFVIYCQLLLWQIRCTFAIPTCLYGPAKYGYFIVQIKVTIRRRILRTALLCTVWFLPAFTWVCLMEGTFLLPGLPDEQPFLWILCDRLDPADSDRIVVVRLTKT